MSSTNPRKFSEKIALLQQKQAEGNTAFEQIMSEVNSVLPTTPTTPQAQPIRQQHLITPSLSYRHHGGSLPNVNQMAQHSEKGSQSNRQFYTQGSSLSPRQSRNSIGPVRSKARVSDHAPYASPPNNSTLSNSMTNAGFYSMMPYGPNIHLSPPENPNWRRTNSDSALNSLLIPSTVPDSSEESSNNSNDPRDNSYSVGMSVIGADGTSPHSSPNHDQNNGGGSGSSNASSRTPTTGCDGSYLGLPQQSISTTGSLPDLTNFPFHSPLQPLDMEERHPNHSPYSTSPVGNSISYSPTSHSPHNTSPVSNSHQQQQLNQQHHHHHQQQQQHHQQAQASQVQISQSQQSPMMDNPLHVNIPFQNYPTDPNMLSAYRDPQRPSPQNSPSPQYRSTSPLLDGHLSSPSSPSSGQQQQQNQSSSAEFYQLQQQMAQFAVGDNHRGMGNNGHWHQGVNPDQSFYDQYMPQSQMPTTGDTAGISSSQSPQHQQPLTPQTPTSIPEISISEFFAAGADFDSRSAELEQFISTEAGVQALRESLGPIEMADLLLLAEQDSLVQLDPQTEDGFRLNRL